MAIHELMSVDLPNDTTNALLMAMEESVSQLLPRSSAHNREALLSELTGYAQAVVDDGRRVHRGSRVKENLSPDAWSGRPVFICGAHRSGTTLMQQLLDGHPELVVLPSEGTYFSSFAYVAKQSPSARDIDRFLAEWICRFVDPNYAPHFRLGRGTLAQNPSVTFCDRFLSWQTALPVTQPALAQFAPLVALMLAMKDVTTPDSKPVMWVEKTPRNETHLARLKAFSDARFIQLVRDPNAILASLRAAHKMAGRQGFDTDRHIWEIGQSLKLASKHAQEEKPRYLVVRYEDLTAHPMQEMERVRQFLDISPSSILLMPTSGGVPVRSNSSFQRTAAGVIASTPQSVFLPDPDACAISALIGRAALEFGYQVRALKRAKRVHAQLRFLAHRAQRGLEFAVDRVLK